MAWNNSDELVVGVSGEVYVAPIGTALPANLNVLPAAWNGLGFTDEDGLSFTADPQVSEYRAWQSRQAVRRELTGLDVSVGFKLAQWNDVNIPLAFGGGAVSLVSAGLYKYIFPDGDDALDERALVFDITDGAEQWRWVFPRGNVSESVNADFRRTELALLPITFKVLAPQNDPNGSPGYLLTNSAQMAVGS